MARNGQTPGDGQTACPPGWSDEDVYAGHFRRYTKSILIKVLEENGFKVHFASYIFMVLPLPIFFLRTIPFLFARKVIQKSNVQSDHKTEAGLLKRLVLFLLSLENKFLRKLISLPFGGTILLVAEK